MNHSSNGFRIAHERAGSQEDAASRTLAASPPGGLGGTAADPEGAALAFAGGARDSRLLERAIRERWPIPPHLRSLIPQVLGSIVESGQASDRNRIAAARALLAADSLNVQEARPSSGDVHIHTGDVSQIVFAARQQLVAAQSFISEPVPPTPEGSATERTRIAQDASAGP